MTGERIPWWELPGLPGENRTREQYNAEIAALKEPNPYRRGKMRGLATNEERQMIREKTGWECCGRCDSPIACAKDFCCARFGDEGDNLGLDIPPERDRTDAHRKDIDIAWLLVDIPDSDHDLNSTEGHLAVLRGIQYGRKQERKEHSCPPTSDDLTAGQLFNLLLSRISFDGMDPRTFSLAELQGAIVGAEWPNRPSPSVSRPQGGTRES